ncbi:hypothetical protein NBRC116594_35380 [Shimia sp. NS0008-38b]|uniref:hypothetical protein n=1 Tax=Shimia sp. NS0008-38b TaxID=3127653 RepID=UPI00310569F8
MTNDAKKFQQAMLSIYEEGKAATGYNATRFLAMVREQGGVETAKSLLAGNPSAVSEGFANLALHSRLDLSVEALVPKDEWRHLFTASELSVAKRRLASKGK